MSTMRLFILPVLLANSNFELRTGCQVQRINLDSTKKKATGVTYIDNAGREFELPMRGGKVGRDEDSLVHLSDPTVSRHHGMIELRDGALTFVAGKQASPTSTSLTISTPRSIAACSGGAVGGTPGLATTSPALRIRARS